MPDNARVLVVEDEARIRELVCLHLQLAGHTCDPVGDGQEALAKAAATRYDLIVLDLMLPRLDGMTVCRAIRRGGPNHDTPILMLTARAEESDKVLGLESGADDYLTKPFGVRELVARAAALLRRPRSALPETHGGARISVAGIDIDPSRFRVLVDGGEVELTRQEMTALTVLASHPGIVFSRAALMQKVWQGNTYVTERSVDTLVKRLRRKIEPDPANPKRILTVWGTGYKFSDQ